MKLKQEHIKATIDFDCESGRWRVTQTIVDPDLAFIASPEYKYFKTRPKAQKYAHNLRKRYSTVSIRE